jgi:hypothetical protein
MKADFTRLGLIIDRSGSMHSIADLTVKAINTFIDEQKLVPGHATIKVAQFDDSYDVMFDTPIQQAPKLVIGHSSNNEVTYKVRGSTALLDAQGIMINTIGKEIDVMPEDQRPSRVIIVTITDGHENSSLTYNLAQISGMIREQTDKYQWEFLFLGANQDAIATAASIGIHRGHALNFMASVADPSAMLSAMNATGSTVRKMRSGVCGQSTNYSDVQRSSSLGSQER